jgi:hypothetical protein
MPTCAASCCAAMISTLQNVWLRPVLLRGFRGLSDRSFLAFICSPCGLSGLRGGGRRSWVKLRTIVGSFGARVSPVGLLGQDLCRVLRLADIPFLDHTTSHRQLAQRQRHQLEHHINHPLRKSPPPSNPPQHPPPSTIPLPLALAMMRNIINYSYPCLKTTVETLFTL